jgi:hypothetical protein
MKEEIKQEVNAIRWKTAVFEIKGTSRLVVRRFHRMWKEEHIKVPKK